MAAADSMQTTYTTCIESDNAVPADLGPQCRLERQDRRGSQISWSLSCANTGVRSDGSAQYRGDTMQATVVNHVPAPAGSVTDMIQHLTGRYLGACQPATAAIPPSSLPPSVDAAGSSPLRAATPAAAPPIATLPATPPPSLQGSAAPAPAPAAGSTAAPPTAAETDAASEPPRAAFQTRRGHVRHGRHAHRSYRHHHGRSAYRAFYAAGSSFGPRPNSGAGP
jgi:hypothetical protein